MTRTVVYSRGPTPAPIMVVGEAPGANEARAKKPFVGASGKEQDRTMERYGINPWRDCYYTNVVKEYRKGNPDPEPEQIAEWSPVLEAEVEAVRPVIILAVGRFAARWFLGEVATMEMCHGHPHHGGCFDPSRAHRAGGAIVVPVYHPAAALRDGKDGGIRSRCYWDYEQAGKIHMCRFGANIIPKDRHLGMEDYQDVGGKRLADILSVVNPTLIGLDTEGTPDAPWSIQVSWTPGSGYCLRVDRPDFSQGIAAIQGSVYGGVKLSIHNAPYDIRMSTSMGLDLKRPDTQIIDTMYDAYLTRLEPQSLKALAWRRCGMRMQAYPDIVREANREKRVGYLKRVAAGSWEPVTNYLETQNDGTVKLWKRPNTVQKRAEKILNDYEEKGEDVDVRKRWNLVQPWIREAAERELGPLPEATLADVPLQTAVAYSCRDADASVRLLGETYA